MNFHLVLSDPCVVEYVSAQDRQAPVRSIATVPLNRWSCGGIRFVKIVVTLPGFAALSKAVASSDTTLLGEI